MAKWRLALVPRGSLSAPIAILSSAYDRSLNFGLDSAGDVSFKMPIDDPMIQTMTPRAHAIVAYRDGVARWSGPIMSIDEDGTGLAVNVRAVGWFAEINGRIMRMPTPSNPTSTMTNPTFASNTNGWNSWGTASTLTRDTGVFDSSPASMSINDTGGIVKATGRFTGTAPAAGQDLALTFKYRFSATSQGAFDAMALQPTYSWQFHFGDPLTDDLAVFRPPPGLLIDNWYTGTIAWTPTGTRVWDTGDTTASKYNRVTSPQDAAFRAIFSNAGAGTLTLRVDSFSFSPASLPVIQKTFTNTQACTIAQTLINDMNTEASSGITVGTAPSTATRTRTYRKYDNVGRAIEELVNVENGFDWTINPLTKVFDMYTSLGSTKPGIHFGFRAGPDNLSRAGRAIDASNLANYIVATGKYGAAVSSDGTSASTYGPQDDVVSIGDFAASDYGSTLLAVSGAELLFRKDPRQLFSITPKPYVAGGSVPQPFVDYTLGDIVYYSAKVGRMNIEAQAVRIFGISISLDESGTERVSELRVVNK